MALQRRRDFLVNEMGTTAPRNCLTSSYEIRGMTPKLWFQQTQRIPLTSLREPVWIHGRRPRVLCRKLYQRQDRTSSFIDYEGCPQSIGSSSNFTCRPIAAAGRLLEYTQRGGTAYQPSFDPTSAQTLNGVQTRALFRQYHSANRLHRWQFESADIFSGGAEQ